MSSQTWPELKADHPIIKLHQKLPEILTASEGYNSIWGLTLIAPPAAEPSAISATPPATTSTPPPADAAAPTPEAGVAAETASVASADKKPVPQPTFGTALILQKFLRANANDVAKAFSQLKDTMVWRKGFFSADGESSKGWSETKFKGIGYVNTIKHKSGVEKVVSWNIYGATKDIKATFGGLDEFIRWRVNLMEESLTRLKLGEATEPIPDYGQGEDPYMSLQVHDYMNVSFLRLPSEVKAASKKTIEMFARYYPETLERKFFVNVPALMGWVYSFIKRLLSNATVSKLEMLSSSKELASWLGEDIPKQYGGNAEPLESGSNSVHSPKDVDGEAAEEAAVKEKEAKEAKAVEEATAAAAAANEQETKPAVVEEVKATEEAPKEAPKEEAAPIVSVTTPAETTVEEPKVAEIPVVAVPETATVAEIEAPKAEETPVAKKEEEVTPLPLTEPVTAEVVVAEAATQPITEVEVREDAPAAPKDISEVPIPAPIALTEAPKVEEKKE